jgi:hypothetical protein
MPPEKWGVVLNFDQYRIYNEAVISKVGGFKMFLA